MATSGVDGQDLLFVYGTLMTGEPGTDDVDVRDSLTRISEASASGSLYSDLNRGLPPTGQ